ncbi:MAG: CopG family antitoxin, partial [Polaromonas sp.]
MTAAPARTKSRVSSWPKPKKVSLPNLKPATKTISRRLPHHLLDSIKVAANARDVPCPS